MKIELAEFGDGLEVECESEIKSWHSHEWMGKTADVFW